MIKRLLSKDFISSHRFNMGIEEEMEIQLRKEFEPTHMVLKDLSDGCGAKFELMIVSKKFDGVKPTIKRHRMVHSSIETEMKNIHAITLKTLTPEEYHKLSIASC